jgi:hypothetical protein
MGFALLVGSNCLLIGIITLSVLTINSNFASVYRGTMLFSILCYFAEFFQSRESFFLGTGKYLNA